MAKMFHKCPNHTAPQLYRAVTNKIWNTKKKGYGKVGQIKTEEHLKKVKTVGLRLECWNKGCSMVSFRIKSHDLKYFFKQISQVWAMMLYFRPDVFKAIVKPVTEKKYRKWE